MINTIQYVIGIVISVAFTAGLFPGVYYLVFPTLLVAIILQILISLFRLRFLNVFVELFLLVLSLLSLIPWFGVVLRIVGIIFAIADMSGFRVYPLYKYAEVRVFSSQSPKAHKKTEPRETSTVREFKKKGFSEAEFKEVKEDLKK